MANVQDREIVMSEFQWQSHDYIYFLSIPLRMLYIPLSLSYGWNQSPTVDFQGWLWVDNIKQRKKLKFNAFIFYSGPLRSVAYIWIAYFLISNLCSMLRLKSVNFCIKA